MNYSDPIPDYGDLMPLADFLSCVEGGLFIDYDGHGHPVKDNLMDSNIWVKPSRLHEIPADATHIMWFNK
jgi:hypothetical protein